MVDLLIKENGEAILNRNIKKGEMASYQNSYMIKNNIILEAEALQDLNTDMKLRAGHYQEGKIVMVNGEGTEDYLVIKLIEDKNELRVQLCMVDKDKYTLIYKEVNKENIENAIKTLREKMEENKAALNYYKEDELYKDKMTPEIEQKIKIKIKVCNDTMQGEIERLEKMLIK